MTLISAAFAAFFAVTLVLYYILPRKWQWCLLLAASIAFYLFSGPKYIAYVVLSGGVTFLSGLMISRLQTRFDARSPELRKTLSREEYKAASAKVTLKKKLWCAAALVADLGILCLVKYLDFILGNILPVFGASYKGLGLIAPLGLSYYTFAAVGYIIDVNRGKYPAEKNPGKFALYLTYFPHIIQGPIPRYDRLAPQFSEEHSFDIDKITDGLRLILWGMFKVLVISGAFGPVVSSLTENSAGMNGAQIWFGMFAWGIQLYTNFSGGIDIVTGVSECFGIALEENFRRPYFAADLTDYWNRWHISLSNWLRDYVFYPIALSKKYAKFAKFLKKKCGKFIARTVPVGLCSLLLFTLVGVWHGANWGEILFGVFNGVIILISTLCEPLFEKLRKPLKMNSLKVWRVFRALRTFIIVTLTRVISRAPDIPTAMKWYAGMFRFSGMFTANGIELFSVELIPGFAALAVLFCVSLVQERSETHSLRAVLKERSAVLRIALEVLLLAAIVVFGSYGIGYDASSFIYKQY